MTQAAGGLAELGQGGGPLWVRQLSLPAESAPSNPAKPEVLLEAVPVPGKV